MEHLNVNCNQVENINDHKIWLIPFIIDECMDTCILLTMAIVSSLRTLYQEMLGKGLPITIDGSTIASYILKFPNCIILGATSEKEGKQH